MPSYYSLELFFLFFSGRLATLSTVTGARQAKEIERLNGALVESDRAARAYKGSHDAAVGIHGRLFDGELFI